MTCFPELTYCMYLDGELAGPERRQVEAHLTLCTRCRSLVEALQAENRLLARLLEQEPEPAAVASARPVRLLDIVWTALAVLVAAVGLRTVSDWFAEIRQPMGVDWLDPFSLSGQLTLFFSSLFYFVEEGATMLISGATTVSALILGLLVIGGGVFLLRRRASSLAVLVGLALLWGLPSDALERRLERHRTITVEAHETIDDTLIAHGEKVIVDGVITGNLIAFAGGVEVNGTVQGDLICFTGGARVKGTVGGNVFAFSGGLDLPGRVGQSIYAFSGGTNIAPSAQVAGNLVAFSGGVNLEGSVEGDLVAFTGGVNLSGRVGHNLTAFTDKLSLASSAQVGKDVRVRVEKQENVRIDPAAKIGGKTEIALTEARVSRYARPKFYLQQVLGLAIVFLIGLLLFWLYPWLFAARIDSFSSALRTAGVGFLAFAATPLAVVIVAVVLCGIGFLAGVLLIAELFPLLLLVLWLIALYLAKLFVGYLLGQALVPSAPGQPVRFALPLLVGLLVVYVAMNLPFVGVVLRFLVWLVGLGLLVIQVRNYGRRMRPAPTA